MKRTLLKSALTFLIVSCVQLANAQLPLEYVYTNHLGGLDEDAIIDLETDSQDNVYVLLRILSNELYWNDSLISNAQSISIIKFNTEGEIIFHTPLVASGDTAFIDVSQICIMENGEIILPGGFRGYLHFGDTVLYRNSAQGFICRFFPDGSPAQIKYLEISEGYAMARQIAIDHNNDIYLAAFGLDTLYFDQNNDTIIAPFGAFKLPVLKMDSEFNLLWLKVFYTEGTLVGKHPIVIDEDNNIIIASMFDGYNLYYDTLVFQFQTENHMLFTKINSLGEMLWAKTADGHYFSTVGYTLCSDEYNNIYFASELNDTLVYDTVKIIPYSFGNGEAVVLSINSDGGFLWFNCIRDLSTWPVEIPPNDIKVKENHVYVGGEFRTDSYFGTIYLQDITSGYDSFLSKMDAETGEFVWAQGFYGNNPYYYHNFGFAFGQGKNIFLSAQFTGQASFGNTTLQSYGGKDVFITKLNETFVGIEESENEHTTFVYPNPGNDKLIIQSPVKGLKIQLYNQTGQLVLEENLQNIPAQTINTSTLHVGLYIYKLTGKDGFQENGKWIKQ